MLSMAETQVPHVIESAPATGGDSATASVAPVIETSTANPAESASPAAIPVESAKTPAVESIKSESTETPTPAENILGDEKTTPEKTEVKKTDVAPKPEGDKPANKEVKTETKEATKPAEDAKIIAPTYEFKTPENVQFDKEPLENFSKLLGELETGKLDHEAYQAKGQQLVDMHVKAVQDTLQRQTESYLSFHKQQGDEWLNAFKKDPELGGGNIQETVSQLQDAVGQYAGNEAQVKEFRDLMVNTNVGKHPALIRLIKNMNDKIQKYESEPQNGMVPAAKPAPVKVKAHQLFYGN